MENNIHHPAGIKADYFAFHIDSPSVMNCLKSAAIITTIAVAVLSSAYLAYQNPNRWCLTISWIIIGNLYTLPKILHFGNSTMVKIALAINLTALGSLALGGLSVASFVLSKNTLTFLKTYQLSNALFATFLITSFIGYGIPLFHGALEKVYCLLNKEEWQERIHQLHDQFQRIPEVGLGFLQTNLWDSFILHLTFLKPEFILDFCRLLNIDPPNYIWPIVTATANQVTIDQFQDMISNMEQIAELAALQQEELPEDIKDSYCMRLKTALRSIKKENLHQALTVLLSNGSKLIPHVISNQKFLELCLEDALDATNELIQQFLDLLSSWPTLHQRYQELSLDIIELEQDIQTHDMQRLTTQEKDDFFGRHKQYAQEFAELRAEIEKIYFNKRIWQSFLPLCLNDDEMLDWPLELDSRLISSVLFDQPLLQEIDQTYRSMIETGGNAPNQLNQHVQPAKARTLNDSLQYITSKLSAINEDDDEEAFSVIMFLGAKKQFIQKDFENLQEWLNLDSLHDLEEAMEKIGLGTEEDFYEKNILPQDGQISKSEICKNLRHYIAQMPKPYLANHIQPQNGINKNSPLNRTIETVTRVLYYSIISGLVLVPILIHPIRGRNGFVLGLSFFILKRFGMPGTQDIADFTTKLMEALPFGGFLVNLLNRRIFTLTPRRRDGANQFVRANFFERMRIINVQIFLALFVSHFTPRAGIPALGGFFQGVSLAGEVVDLV